MLKTLQNITSDREFTAYLVDVAEAFDKTSQTPLTRALAITPIRYKYKQLICTCICMFKLKPRTAYLLIDCRGSSSVLHYP